MASIISHAQLNAQLAQGTIAPLYAVVGEEDLLRDMALGTLKTALLGEGESDFNCDLFYGDDVSGAQIVTCASEVAVFAARRVVVVKAADKLPARECDAILPYLKEPNDSTSVIFVASKLDGRLKFTQALAKAAVTVDCSPLREAQWLPWLRQDAERVGVRLNDEAIEYSRKPVVVRSMPFDVNWKNSLRMSRPTKLSRPPMSLPCVEWSPARRCST